MEQHDCYLLYRYTALGPPGARRGCVRDDEPFEGAAGDGLRAETASLAPIPRFGPGRAALRSDLAPPACEAFKAYLRMVLEAQNSRRREVSNARHRREGRGGDGGHNNVRRQERQFARERREAIDFSLRPSQVQHKILTFDIS